MDREKYLQYLSVADNFGSKGYFDNFNMPCCSFADLFIKRVCFKAAGISRDYGLNSPYLFISRFKAPETSAAQDRSRPFRPFELSWDKADRERINAMARIFFGQPFSCKNMPKMRAAGSAKDFGASAVSISISFYSIRVFSIKARPAAMLSEFIFRIIKEGVAAPTDINTVIEMPVVLTGKRGFSPLVFYNPFFICC